MPIVKFWGYDIYLGDEEIQIDPIERILKGLKTLVLSTSKIRQAPHYAKKRGTDRKFIVFRDWYLKFYEVKTTTLNSLSPIDIQHDIGLTNNEFEKLMTHLNDVKIDLHLFFLIFKRRTNGSKKNTPLSPHRSLYLGRFKITKLVQKKIAEFF